MFTDVNNVNQVFTYSTSKTVRNTAIQNLLNPPTVKSSSQDINRDGFPERWNISMRIRKPSLPSQLTQATIVLGFDYQTSNVLSMSLDTLAVVTLDNLPRGGSTSVREIKTVGTLELKQQFPLRKTVSGRKLYNDGLFSYLEYESLDTFLGQRYFGGHRNETTVYTNQQTYIKRGPSTDSFIDISVIVNIPTKQDIIYSPGVWQVLKFAWIQYYSFLILIYVFLYHFFYGFVIKNKVFDSIEVSQINLSTLLSDKTK